MGQKSISIKIIASITLVVLLIGIVGTYAIKMEWFKKGVTESETYSSSAQMDPERGIIFQKENEDGTISEVEAEEEVEKLFEVLDGAKEYLKDDENSTKEEKLLYLLNAELVTKYPYISSIEGDESKLNGRIKFYRYTNEIEAAEGEQEILEEDNEDNEEENENNEADNNNTENTFNPKEVFYIGDSWTAGLHSYISSNVKDEYGGAEHFYFKSGGDASQPEFATDKIKAKIDAVNSEISTIVIALGLNMANHKPALDSMQKILDFLSTTYSEKNIYVLKVPHVGKAYTRAEVYNINIDNQNKSVLEMCSQIGNIKFIDTTGDMMDAEGYLDEKYLYSDGLHFSSDKGGYEKWYNNIKQCISEGKSIVSTAKSKFQMIYTSPEEFEKLKSKYEQSGDTEVYKYFTINEENEIVIAYGRTTSTTVSTDDKEVNIESLSRTETTPYEEVEENIYQLTKYSIREGTYDYKSLIDKYALPFNLLWAFLIQTEDYELTKAIADLAYESEIHIGIYDNKAKSVSNSKRTYNKAIRYAENTELIFPGAGLGQLIPSRYDTDPRFWNIARKCYSNVQENSVAHDICGMRGWKMCYVSGVDEDGKISNISNSATLYTTETNVVTVSNPTPTIGVVLVDCWTGRWEAKYALVSDDPDNSSSTSNVTEPRNDEFVNADNEKISSDLWEKEGSSMYTNLTAHSETISQMAIEDIVERTDFSQSVDAGQVARHIDSCGSCQAIIFQMYNKTVQQLKEEGPTDYASLIVRDKNYIGVSTVRNQRPRIYAHALAAQKELEKANLITQLNNTITYSQWPTVQRADTNIIKEDSSVRNTHKYEKESTTRENEGEKFKEIFSKKEHNSAKKILKGNIEWFWEYIRAAEDTAKLEDLLRYMFNIAFDTDQFGTFESEDIEKIYSIFEPKQLKNASGGHLSAFSEWLKSYENNSLRRYMNEDGIPYSNVEKYVTEDREYGKMYYTSNDGCWNFTYGIMVCNRHGNYNNVEIFAEYLYDIPDLVERAKKGEEILIPMDDLEEIKEELIRRKKDALTRILKDEHDLTLKPWQIYGLLNFSYQWGNCGEDIEGENNIAEVYKKYYVNQNDPEAFKKNAVLRASSGDLVHFYYAKYQNRQDSAWIMFNEGRYILSSGEEIFVTGETAELILEACETVMNELLDNNVHYYRDNSELIWNDIERSSDYSSGIACCCATYVGSVLYKAEIFSADYINKYNYNLPGCPDSLDSIFGMLKDAGWEIVDPEDALPGDIATFCTHNYVFDDGHIGTMCHAYIYAGGDLVWDENTGCIPKKPTNGLPSGRPLRCWNQYLSQHEVFVFRPQ